LCSLTHKTLDVLEYNSVVDYYSSGGFSTNFSQFLQTISNEMLLAIPWLPAKRVNQSLLRHSCWFTEGLCKCKYSYSGTKWPPCVYPNWLLQLGKYMSSIAGEEFNSVNANYYEDGSQGIGPHSDNEPLFYDEHTWESKETIIASISFGAGRNIEFKHKFVHDLAFKQSLSNHDIMVMRGETQKHFQHSIPTDSSSGTRVNFTFRRLKRHQAYCPYKGS
jgi:alkylated DNA repair dioxygenase AlkB